MSIFSENDVMVVQDVIRKTNGQTQHHGSQPVAAGDEADELNHRSDRIQRLIGEIESLPAGNAKELMQECIENILGFYGKGLEKILKIIAAGNSSAARDIYNHLIEDSFVNGLLLIHDLHPLDIKTRLFKALETVKPYMDSHGGSVELISIDDGIARLRLAGNCKGCPSSSATLELGIRQAIEEYCPDLSGLEVEGVSQPHDHLPLKKEQGWQIVNGPDKLSSGRMVAQEVNGTALIICRVDQTLYAFKNLCPACNRSFSGGSLSKNELGCQLGHRYDVQRAGLCTDDDTLHLEPFPLLEENGTVKIAVR